MNKVIFFSLFSSLSSTAEHLEVFGFSKSLGRSPFCCHPQRLPRLPPAQQPGAGRAPLSAHLRAHQCSLLGAGASGSRTPGGPASSAAPSEPASGHSAHPSGKSRCTLAGCTQSPVLWGSGTSSATRYRQRTAPRAEARGAHRLPPTFRGRARGKQWSFQSQPTPRGLSGLVVFGAGCKWGGLLTLRSRRRSRGSKSEPPPSLAAEPRARALLQPRGWRESLSRAGRHERPAVVPPPRPRPWLCWRPSSEPACGRCPGGLGCCALGRRRWGRGPGTKEPGGPRGPAASPPCRGRARSPIWWSSSAGTASAASTRSR